MKIIVCIKQIRHTYARTGMDHAQHFLALEDNIYRVNPHDEAAIELALRATDNRVDTEIALLTMGSQIAEEALRRCLAMGADHLYRIESNRSPDPWEKSLALTRTIKDLNADLILCGKESIDTQNGQVPALVAHHLGMPFVSAVVDVEISKDNIHAIVKRSCGRGLREEIQCRLPALFSVDSGGIEPRLPTYEARVKASAYTIKTIPCASNNTGRKIISERRYPPRPRPKKMSVPDSRLDAYHRIQRLFSGNRVEKKGEMLTGTTASQVEGIISFLSEHGFIKSEQEEKK
jgi:electron transfer flavoprotein beta subunit